ncbi:DUF5803 family protein [Halorientalis salina]|uniref:DUF5803 family protein n=1 Tax=Halorientalis salina TaxID=2932266 RepID=UPI0010ABA7CB|nr:DUF5803 family protein [Halorientalis salina]
MTRRRLLVGVGLLALLAALAGCSTILGPGEPDPEKIEQNVSYDWNTSANATFDITKDEYTAVYVVDNQSELELYQRDALGTRHPLDIEGVKFRYQNGTVTNVSAENVDLQRKRAVVSTPAEDGKLAFRSPRRGKQFGMPTFVSGSYEATLPPGARVDIPILAQVSPRGHETSIDDDRVTVSWDEVEAQSVSIRWYLARDLLLFGGLFALMLVVGAIGAIYYLRQIRALEAQREEVGLDVDTGDDSDDGGPPPGMR